MAQLVKHPTLDFGRGHDLTVMRSSPTLGSMLGMELLWILSLSLLLPLPCSHVLFLALALALSLSNILNK